MPETEEPQVAAVEPSDGAIDAVLAQITSDTPTETPEVPEAVEAPTEAVESNERTPEVDAAIATLKFRGNYPAKALESASSEELLGWAADADKAGRERDRVFQERAELTKELAEFKARSADEPKVAEQGSNAMPAPTTDLELDVAQVAEYFGADQEGKDAFAAFGKSIEARILQRLQPTTAAVDNVQALMVNQMLDSARAGLTEAYPVLAGDGYDGVIGTMQALKQAGLHAELSGSAQISALMRSAAALSTPDEAPPVETEATKAAKRSGSPTPPTPSKERKAPDRVLSQGELMEQKAVWVTQNPGATSDDVKRAFGEL